MGSVLLLPSPSRDVAAWQASMALDEWTNEAHILR